MTLMEAVGNGPSLSPVPSSPVGKEAGGLLAEIPAGRVSELPLTSPLECEDAIVVVVNETLDPIVTDEAALDARRFNLSQIPCRGTRRNFEDEGDEDEGSEPELRGVEVVPLVVIVATEPDSVIPA